MSDWFDGAYSMFNGQKADLKPKNYLGRISCPCPWPFMRLCALKLYVVERQDWDIVNLLYLKLTVSESHFPTSDITLRRVKRFFLGLYNVFTPIRS